MSNRKKLIGQRKFLMRTMLNREEVSHEIKVTRIKGKGWGVRCYTNGILNQDSIAETREEIGIIARDMLRMEDKCGNYSPYAWASRQRRGNKEQLRRLKEQE